MVSQLNLNLNMSSNNSSSKSSSSNSLDSLSTANERMYKTLKNLFEKSNHNNIAKKSNAKKSLLLANKSLKARLSKVSSASSSSSTSSVQSSSVSSSISSTVAPKSVSAKVISDNSSAAKPAEDIEPDTPIGFKENSKGEKLNNFEPNYIVAVQKDPKLNQLFYYNTFAQEPYIKRENGQLLAVNDNDINRIKIEIEIKYSLIPRGDNILEQAVDFVAQEHKYNPVKDIIFKEKWDKKPRVPALLHNFLGASDDRYTRLVMTRFLCGAVKRVLEPGCTMEIVPILCGPQGIGKSTLIYKLFSPFDLTDLASMTASSKVALQLKKAWGVELQELSALRDLKAAKSFISDKVFTYRAPYQKSYKQYLCHNCYIGTTNNSDILGDSTGNRRLFPIKCGVVKPKLSIHDDFSKHTKYQIWAEALVRLKNGCKTYVSNAENKKIDNQVRKNFQIYNPIVANIKRYLAMRVPKNWHSLSLGSKKSYYSNYYNNQGDNGNSNRALYPIDWASQRELISVALGRNNPVSAARGHLGSQSASAAESLGWKKSRITFDGHRIRVFKRDSRNA